MLPLAGPVLLGSIAEIEERTMALEARGFTRPGPPDAALAPARLRPQAVARWLLLAGGALIIVARAVGWLPWLG